jgi:hypothetical protein
MRYLGVLESLLERVGGDHPLICSTYQPYTQHTQGHTYAEDRGYRWQRREERGEGREERGERAEDRGERREERGERREGRGQRAEERGQRAQGTHLLPPIKASMSNVPIYSSTFGSAIVGGKGGWLISPCPSRPALNRPHE